MSNAHEPTYHDPQTAHEQSDVSFRPVIIGGALLALMCLICFVVVIGVFHLFTGAGFAWLPGTETANLDVAPMEQLHTESAETPRTYPLAQPQEPFGPGVQVNPPADLAALLAEEDAILNTYAWVDRENGVVRIPIARAMELLVKQGLPTRPNPPAVEGPMYPEASSSGRMMERLVP
ncbi:MAG TPA: hypothetical protein VND92_05500 [Vicinamibacterales bacterium]|nr:hypothetical protein [Vicinamibacterales bacterium]